MDEKSRVTMQSKLASDLQSDSFVQSVKRHSGNSDVGHKEMCAAYVLPNTTNAHFAAGDMSPWRSL